MTLVTIAIAGHEIPDQKKQRAERSAIAGARARHPPGQLDRLRRLCVFARPDRQLGGRRARRRSRGRQLSRHAAGRRQSQGARRKHPAAHGRGARFGQLRYRRRVARYRRGISYHPGFGPAQAGWRRQHQMELAASTQLSRHCRRARRCRRSAGTAAIDRPTDGGRPRANRLPGRLVDMAAIPVDPATTARHYRAPWWLPGGHLQTTYPGLALKRYRMRYTLERWDTTPQGRPDGDFIDVDRLARATAKPTLGGFQCLEGQAESIYAVNLMREAERRGWRGMVPHFRGCSGELNRLPRAYHSGDAAEIDWILRRAKAEAPDQT